MFSLSYPNVSPKASEKPGIDGADFENYAPETAEGCIIIELKYRETSASPLITYHLAIDEENNRPFIAEEWLQWRRGAIGKTFSVFRLQKRGRTSH
jgi:hypothetical protein